MTPGVVAETDLAGTLKSEYMFFDGERVARKDFPGNSVAYYFSDHLKTASVITDSAGNITAESDYYPWGGELQFVNNDYNHYKYGGHEHDNETGLEYYGARYSSNPMGRWLSPDWSAVPVPVPYADLSNPQSLNQYAYVRNNPMSYGDADGHDCPLCPPETIPEATPANVQKTLDGVQKATQAAEEGAGGVSFSAILTGVAIVFVPAMLFPDALPGGTASSDWPKDANGNYVRLDGQSSQGQGQTLGQARGAGEEHSQSDDANDRARTNGGLVKPPAGKGSVPKDQRDPKPWRNRQG